MTTSILPVNPVIDPAMRALCLRPYRGHKHGCPNYGRRKTCPPEAPMYDDIYDLSKPVFAIINEFDLAGHVSKMKTKHPKWSYAQLSCLLYWQGSARKVLRTKIKDFLIEHPGYVAETCPEAMGVNVTQTLADAGVILEWPPILIARQVALAGIPINKEVLE